MSSKVFRLGLEKSYFFGMALSRFPYQLTNSVDEVFVTVAGEHYGLVDHFQKPLYKDLPSLLHFIFHEPRCSFLQELYRN